jgi:hypothetical protein
MKLMNSSSLTERVRDILPSRLTVFERVRRDHSAQMVSVHGEQFAVIAVDPATTTEALRQSDAIQASLAAADVELREGRTSSLDSLLQPAWLRRRRRRPGPAPDLTLNVEIQTVDEGTTRMVVEGPSSQISALHHRVQHDET